MTIQIEKDRSAVLMEDVPWDYYSRTLEVLGAAGGKRITYDQGRMEIVTTSVLHERIKAAIGQLLTVYSYERRVRMTSDASVTLRREGLARGLEADDCYYVQTTPPPPTEGAPDLTLYAPPDLAIEVEVSKGAIPKLPIYAALGVREVWRWDGREIIPMELQDGQYVPLESSKVMPDLSLKDFSRFVRMALEVSQFDAIDAYHAYFRSQGR